MKRPTDLSFVRLCCTLSQLVRRTLQGKSYEIRSQRIQYCFELQVPSIFVDIFGEYKISPPRGSKRKKKKIFGFKICHDEDNRNRDYKSFNREYLSPVIKTHNLRLMRCEGIYVLCTTHKNLKST